MVVSDLKADLNRKDSEYYDCHYGSQFDGRVCVSEYYVFDPNTKNVQEYKAPYKQCHKLKIGEKLDLVPWTPVN